MQKTSVRAYKVRDRHMSHINITMLSALQSPHFGHVPEKREKARNRRPPSVLVSQISQTQHQAAYVCAVLLSAFCLTGVRVAGGFAMN